jgi:UDP-3-O-[3-hydroxymyristoyl] N-acetylglucosamine deacetylase/3-hydroxyacyl-[acyl-carrier-protein] dehydratase
MKQTTLKESFHVSGKGLHTGLQIEAELLPAPENHGYKFQRIDLEGQPEVDAVAENVVATTRGTVIGRGQVQVSTIEHCLAALYAAGIDNCLIRLNAPEMPILDGSARVYCEEIARVGIEGQAADKDFYVVKQKIEVHDDSTGASIVVLPDDDFSIDTMVAFDSPVLQNQFASLEKMSDFAEEVASSRTFGEAQPHQGWRSGQRHSDLRHPHGSRAARPHRIADERAHGQRFATWIYQRSSAEPRQRARSPQAHGRHRRPGPDWPPHSR